MKKPKTIIIAVLLAAVFNLPVFAEAAASPGIKPGSFFYFFDTAFEKVGLLFTFSPEKKAEKALRYANERLAEAEAVTDNADAVKTAVTNYENSIAFANEKSKDVVDKEKAEALLTAISDNTSKHQDVLKNVLAKVPEEAKEAITKAIEISRRGKEEAMRKIAELQGEVEKLKQEVTELKIKDEEREKMIEELDTPKIEKPATPQKPSAIAPITPTQKPEPLQMQAAPKTSIVTLPSGAVVEMDQNGNIIRYIKEVQAANVTTKTPAIQATSSPTAPLTQTEAVEIISVNLTVGTNSAKFEWRTNQPTESKVFVSGENFPSQAFYSESGISTHHSVTISSLSGGRAYLYEIEAVTSEKNIARKHDGFQTASLPFTPQPIIPEVKKEIRILEVRGCDINRDKVITEKCRVEVWYSENNVRVPASIIISAEKGTFYTIDNPIREGNPLTSSASSLNPYDNKPNTYFDYVPSSEQIKETITENARIIYEGKQYDGKIISYQWTINPTVTANGVTSKGEFTWTQHLPF